MTQDTSCPVFVELDSRQGDDMEHLVRAAKGFTGAQIEELANTIYLLAVDGNSCHNGTGEACERVAVTGELIDTALEEVRVEEGRKAGFEGGL